METQNIRFSGKLTSHSHLLAIAAVYLLLSFASCAMVTVRMLHTGRWAYLFLIWNLFLTWIPFGLSLLMSNIYLHWQRGKLRLLVILCLGAAWAAFYPNAPYMITDFIHLSNITFYYGIDNYNMSLMVWYDLIMISLFIFTGFLLGFVSLYLVQGLLADRFKKWLGWIFVGGMLFLSSFGIYLGRFIRWNSWDMVTRPMELAGSILESLHTGAFAFTLLFGAFLTLIYIALYCLTNLGMYRKE